ADENKKEGDAFLAANKTQSGVITLPSGLQYKILKPGTGPRPTKDDTVVCNYKGTLLNGKEFDSSYKRGQAATFPVGQVIPGWTEALQLMPVVRNGNCGFQQTWPTGHEPLDQTIPQTPRWCLKSSWNRSPPRPNQKRTSQKVMAPSPISHKQSSRKPIHPRPSRPSPSPA